MNFRRWVVFTFLVHMLVVVVDKGGGLVLYLLTVKQPDQHGKSGIVASLPFIMMAVANLGLATSLVYFLRKKLYTAQQAFETTMTVALVWGGIVAALAFVLTSFVLPAINPHWNFSPWLVLPWCLAVPLLLVASYGNSIQLALERVRDYGVVHLVTSVAFLPAFFAVFFWLGGDVGVWLSMAFVRDARLSFETRATIIKLAFYVDLFPRVAFALMIPVGVQLAGNLGLLPASDALRAAAWLVGLGWAALHLSALFLKGSPLALTLRKVNVAFEALVGALFVGLGGAALLGVDFSASLGPIAQAPWFATKLLLFGLIFWVVLGIDTRFQPFTTLLQAGPTGLTPEREAKVRSLTDQTMAWALLLYALIRRGWRAVKSGVFWIVLAMVALTAAGHFGIQPLLAQLKADALPRHVMESTLKDRFATWHGISSGLYLLQSLLGVWLVLWSERGKR